MKSTEKRINKLKQELRFEICVLENKIQKELDKKGILKGVIFNGLSGSSMVPCRLKFKKLTNVMYSTEFRAMVVKVKKDGTEHNLTAHPFVISIKQLKEWFSNE